MIRRLRAWRKYGSVGSPKRAAFAFDLFIKNQEQEVKVRREVAEFLAAWEATGFETSATAERTHADLRNEGDES